MPVWLPGDWVAEKPANSVLVPARMVSSSSLTLPADARLHTHRRYDMAWAHLSKGTAAGLRSRPTGKQCQNPRCSENMPDHLTSTHLPRPDLNIAS